jgi:predicted metal-binding membrane protein
MVLLFVGGIMNLLWIAGLAVFVLLEKVLPRRWVTATSGVSLMLWGGFVLAGLSS